jgi:Tol biopolymer transport system component
MVQYHCKAVKTSHARRGAFVERGNTTDRAPVYSPDGQQIAYSNFDGRQDWEIFTIPATGGTPINVTNNTTNEYNPSWQLLP